METGKITIGATGDMTSHGDAHDCAAPVLDFLKVHEGAVSHALLDESSTFLESLRLAVTTGKVCACVRACVCVRVCPRLCVFRASSYKQSRR